MLRQLWSAHDVFSSDSTLWVLDGIPSRDARTVECWLNDIAALTLDEWATVGRAMSDRSAGAERRTAARALLHAIIANRKLDLTAWFIEDLVSTACHAARQSAARCTRSRRQRVDGGLCAAESAALAIATRSWLPEADWRALCAPFQGQLAITSISI